MAFYLPDTDLRGQPYEGRSVASAATDIICFSHLRWGFVWQRPQHLMTRFSSFARVFFIEEPIIIAETDFPRLEYRNSMTVTVVTPYLPQRPGMEGGFNQMTNVAIRALITPFLRDQAIRHDSVLWYYTPMALGAEPGCVSAPTIVFDAMDELANFRSAPAELRSQETALLERADLVFTGGPSLHEARRRRHPHTYCFPSGVDAAHFCYDRGRRAPDDIGNLPRPIVGYYGVLDERIDFELLEHIAARRPKWSIVMIGPLAKIGEADLARRPNIHYLGKRTYEELPAYLACFDVAMMPFAANESTRFISPTKTLEYLAGDKPIVSTPINDVIDLYGEVVNFADSAAPFIRAVEACLAEPAAEHMARARAANAILARHDWDHIARGMFELILDAVCVGQSDTAPHRVDHRELILARPLSTPVASVSVAD